MRGVCSFYVPRSDPDRISVSARCVEGLDPDALPLEDFDGRLWERAYRERAHRKRRGGPAD